MLGFILRILFELCCTSVSSVVIYVCGFGEVPGQRIDFGGYYGCEYVSGSLSGGVS